MGNRIFFMPDRSGYIVFEQGVLLHMYGHVQRRYWSCEAGGQLFSSSPNDSAVLISAASGPNSRDQRSRHAFRPNAPQATQDRQMQFALGKHAVGLWHTHPEPCPSPSGLDERTTKEWLSDFEGQMTGFLLVIVGNKGEVPAMAVWLASNSTRSDWIRMPEFDAGITI